MRRILLLTVVLFALAGAGTLQTWPSVTAANFYKLAWSDSAPGHVVIIPADSGMATIGYANSVAGGGADTSWINARFFRFDRQHPDTLYTIYVNALEANHNTTGVTAINDAGLQIVRAPRHVFLDIDANGPYLRLDDTDASDSTVLTRTLLLVDTTLAHHFGGQSQFTIGDSWVASRKGWIGAVADDSLPATIGYVSRISSGGYDSLAPHFDSTGDISSGDLYMGRAGIGVVPAWATHDSSNGLRIFGAIVAGDTSNRSASPYGGVFSGNGNTASGAYSMVASGLLNVSSGYLSTVSGGTSNYATDTTAAVLNGGANTAMARSATVGNGISNSVKSKYSTIMNGESNAIETLGVYNHISNGYSNVMFDSVRYGTILNGISNHLGRSGTATDSAGWFSTILGGEYIEMVGKYSVAGGQSVTTDTITANSHFTWFGSASVDTSGPRTGAALTVKGMVNTDTVTATEFAGHVTGNVTGALTGNASTADSSKGGATRASLAANSSLWQTKDTTTAKAIFGTVAADVKAQDTANAALAGITPVGGIIMWYGDSASVPVNWWICNGDSGTPPIYNKFVVGAVTDSAGTPRSNVLGGQLLSTGGSNAHTHTLLVPGGAGIVTGAGVTPSVESTTTVPPFIALWHIMRLR